MLLREDNIILESGTLNSHEAENILKKTFKISEVKFFEFREVVERSVRLNLDLGKIFNNYTNKLNKRVALFYAESGTKIFGVRFFSDKYLDAIGGFYKPGSDLVFIRLRNPIADTRNLNQIECNRILSTAAHEFNHMLFNKNNIVSKKFPNIIYNWHYEFWYHATNSNKKLADEIARRYVEVSTKYTEGNDEYFAIITKRIFTFVNEINKNSNYPIINTLANIINNYFKGNVIGAIKYANTPSYFNATMSAYKTIGVNSRMATYLQEFFIESEIYSIIMTYLGVSKHDKGLEILGTILENV